MMQRWIFVRRRFGRMRGPALRIVLLRRRKMREMSGKIESFLDVGADLWYP